MTKRDDQILPPSTLRAVDEWERESEIELTNAEQQMLRRSRERSLLGVTEQWERDWREFYARQQATTMPSPADRKLTSRQFKGALVAAFAAGWGAVELVRWVVE
jgi:hypothetical protein